MNGNVVPGINVIGNISANFGVRVHARPLFTLLLDRRFPAKFFDIDPMGERGRHDTQFEDINVNSPDELPHPINKFMLQRSAVFAFPAAHKVTSGHQVDMPESDINESLVINNLGGSDL